MQNAVHFLNNPTVRNTPLAKKVAFMEKKGLTSEEIKEALRRATLAAGQAQDDEEEDEPEQVYPYKIRGRTLAKLTHKKNRRLYLNEEQLLLVGPLDCRQLRHRIHHPHRRPKHQPGEVWHWLQLLLLVLEAV